MARVKRLRLNRRSLLRLVSSRVGLRAGPVVLVVLVVKLARAALAVLVVPVVSRVLTGRAGKVAKVEQVALAVLAVRVAPGVRVAKAAMLAK